MSCVNRTVRTECHESGCRQGIFRYCRNGDNIFSHASALFSRLFYYLCGIDPSCGIRVHHKLYTGSCCSSFFVFLFNCKYTIFTATSFIFHFSSNRTADEPYYIIGTKIQLLKTICCERQSLESCECLFLIETQAVTLSALKSSKENFFVLRLDFAIATSCVGLRRHSLSLRYISS